MELGVNEKFKRREIILAKLSNHKVVPMLIVQNKNKMIGLQLYKSQEKKERYKIKKSKSSSQTRGNKYVVNIGQPEGVIFESVVNVTRNISLKGIQKIRVLSHIDRKLHNKIANKYNSFLEDGSKDYKQLHKELKELNVKIELCKFNNQRYEQYVTERNAIAKKLGYHSSGLKKRRGIRRSLDYVEPIHTPYITVYRF